MLGVYGGYVGVMWGLHRVQGDFEGVIGTILGLYGGSWLGLCQSNS